MTQKTAWKKAFKIIYIVLVVLSVLVVGVFLYLKYGIRPPDISTPTPPVISQKPNGPSGGQPGTSASPGPQDSEEPVQPALQRREYTYTCLIFGEDAVSGSTDTIMAATFDVPNQKIGLVSIPRDTKVRSDLNQASDKINAAYALGGAEQLKREMEELLGIPIDFYVKIRLTAFQRLVDEVGGVWFEVPFDMKYDDPTQNLHIDQPAGLRKLTGEDAMEVVRYRQDNYGNDSFGDTGRAGVQQAFLKAMLSQVISNAKLENIPTLVDILLNYVDTNASVNDMLYFGKSLVGMDIDSAVVTGTLPATWVYPFMIVEKEEALEVINTLLSPYGADTPITEDMVQFLDP